MSVAMAATKIQNLWKGAIARRQVKKQREEELAFIGMVNVYRKCIIQDLKNELHLIDIYIMKIVDYTNLTLHL